MQSPHMPVTVTMPKAFSFKPLIFSGFFVDT
jgi:hypothetical protein